MGYASFIVPLYYTYVRTYVFTSVIMSYNTVTMQSEEDIHIQPAQSLDYCFSVATVQFVCRCTLLHVFLLAVWLMFSTVYCKF